MKTLVHVFGAEKLSLSKFWAGSVALFVRCLQGLHARWFRAQVSASLPAETCSKPESAHSRNTFLKINSQFLFL